MTIQQAIQSGKPFKRKHPTHDNKWYYLSPSGVIKVEVDEARCEIRGGVSFLAQDILADDWEVKEQ